MSEAKAVEEFDSKKFIEALGTTGAGVLPTVEISTGVKVKIKKATAAQVFLILKVLKSIAKTMNLDSLDDLASIAERIDNPVQFLEMLEASHDHIFDLISALCSIGVESLMTCDLDDVLIIAWAEWKVNEHFFTTRLMPTLQKLGTEQESVK